jgi:AcrR family transcriptional regulator
MTGVQRREQLVEIGRKLFAEKGLEGTSVEEIAASAGVSKPVVYEHFGGKDGLYAVVVEHETQKLLAAMTAALTLPGHPRRVLEIATLTLLDYIETETDGFRILVRDSPVTQPGGGFASLISDVASHVEYILGAEFASRGFEARMAPLYAQMLVGMVALTGQFWLDHRKPEKAVVAAHLVNLAWNGLTGLETRPALSGPEDLGLAPESGPAEHG